MRLRTVHKRKRRATKVIGLQFVAECVGRIAAATVLGNRAATLADEEWRQRGEMTGRLLQLSLLEAHCKQELSTSAAKAGRLLRKLVRQKRRMRLRGM